MALAGLAKTATWGLRLFQFLFAIILMGILSFMVHEFREFHSKVPREVTVPEVFSVLAVAFSLFSMLSVCFLNYTFQLVATFLDFAIWVGYLASAGLLHVCLPLQVEPGHLGTDGGLIRTTSICTATKTSSGMRWSTCDEGTGPTHTSTSTARL